MRQTIIKERIKSSSVKLGTSGVRGLVSAVTDKIGWLDTKGCVQFRGQRCARAR
ncbi:phosphomannomutase, partial [Francisella tularensis subsp. holarctica]|nr:phosphomannomutase [Francisella tularensis subsp. holarctica]